MGVCCQSSSHIWGWTRSSSASRASRRRCSAGGPVGRSGDWSARRIGYPVSHSRSAPRTPLSSDRAMEAFVIRFDPSSPVNLLADRFWEAILEQSPTTATMYGDARYDDRLEDPSALGRARARELAETTLRA